MTPNLADSDLVREGPGRCRGAFSHWDVPSTWWLQNQATALPSKAMVFWMHHTAFTHGAIVPLLGQPGSLPLVPSSSGSIWQEPSDPPTSL